MAAQAQTIGELAILVNGVSEKIEEVRGALSQEIRDVKDRVSKFDADVRASSRKTDDEISLLKQKIGIQESEIARLVKIVYGGCAFLALQLGLLVFYGLRELLARP